MCARKIYYSIEMFPWLVTRNMQVYSSRRSTAALRHKRTLTNLISMAFVEPQEVKLMPKAISYQGKRDFVLGNNVKF